MIVYAGQKTLAEWFWWTLILMAFGCLLSWVFVRMHMNIIDRQTFEKIEHKKRKEIRELRRRISEKKSMASKGNNSGHISGTTIDDEPKVRKTEPIVNQD